MIETPKPSEDTARRPDRLAALLDRFRLRVTPCPAAEAQLAVISPPRARVVLAPGGGIGVAPGERVEVAARVDWGGQDNPVLHALPPRTEILLGQGDDGTGALAALFTAEAAARRCGAGPVLDRLGEVLVIRLIRAAIERGSAEPGLLAGLADPRLSRAIVAMHEAPARRWRNADLAERAGLSVSRFSELFLAATGETPMGYLRRWRLGLARADLARGARVQAVALRCGYGSGEALAHALRREGSSPG